MPASMSIRIQNFLVHQVHPYASAKDKKPLFQQIKEMLELFRTYHYLPYQYFKFNMYFKSAGDAYRDCIAPELVHRVQLALNPLHERDVAANKAKFSALMRKHKIPAIHELFRQLEDGTFVDELNKPLPEESVVKIIKKHGNRVFMKPTYGTRGQRTGIFDFIKEGGILPSAGSDILFQPLIVQHEDVSRFNSTSVNTVRIVTLNTGNRVQLDGAVFRMGLKSRNVDNWSAGGVGVGVNLKTGQLQKYGVRERKFGGEIFTQHPDSNFVFDGYQLPFWNEALALVSKAAEVIRPLQTIGWDVAMTPDGPIIVEANEEWHVEFLQICYGGLGQTPIGKLALHYWKTGKLT